MNLTLKNFKYAQFASEETDCFSAAVCVDGKPKLIASNDGHGGCNNYEPLPRGRAPTESEMQDYRDTMAKLQAWVATLPPEKDKELGEFKRTLDCVIGDLVLAQLLGRDFDRLIRSKIVFITGGKIMTLSGRRGWKPHMATETDYANIAKKFPDATILNTLERAEGLAAYAKAGDAA